jgi:hypothetical protein
VALRPPDDAKMKEAAALTRNGFLAPLGELSAALSASPCWSLEPACGICRIAPNICSLLPTD